MAELYLKYVTFTDDRHAFVCALWCAQTWFFQTENMHGIDSVGYLAFVSPVKNCGKSGALRVTGALSWGQPSIDVVPTPAIIFRDIGTKRHTIILDELDVLRDNPDLVAVLNAGYKRDSKVKRMGGRDKETVMHFQTFCPKALGYIRDSGTIKAIKSTLESRCIRILLKKRTQEEQTTAPTLRHRRFKVETFELANQLSEWSFAVPNDLGPVFESVIETHPALDFGIDGREMEVWENLLMVAHLAGRLDEAVEVAIDLIKTNREEVEDHNSDGPLLVDIRDNLDVMCDDYGFSTELAVEFLSQLADRTYLKKLDDGQRFNSAYVAKTLAKYGLRTRKVGHAGVKRINRDRLVDTLARHLPPLDVAA